MREYTVNFTIEHDGHIRIMANSPEEAEQKFSEMWNEDIIGSDDAEMDPATYAIITCSGVDEV